MASCNVEINSCQDKNERETLSRIDNPLNEETNLMENTSLETDTCMIDNSPQSVRTDSQNNEELECSSLKSRKRKRQKGMQDARGGKISSINNSSKADFKTVQPSEVSLSRQETKIKKHRQKHKNIMAGEKDCVSSEVGSTSLRGTNTFIAEKQSVSTGSASVALTKNYDKGHVSHEVVSASVMTQDTSISKQHSGSPRSTRTSLMSESDNAGKEGLVSMENANGQSVQREKCFPKMGKGESPNSLGNSAQDIVLAGEKLLCDSYNSSYVFGNRLEVAQVGVHAASMEYVENDLTEKDSALSNGDINCEEDDKVAELKDNVDVGCHIKEENIPQLPHSSLEGPLIRGANRKLLILDVNGLLADIVPYAPYGSRPDITVSRKSVFKRPFCDDFLQFCLEKFEVGLWSSRTKRNVDMVVDFLLGDSKHKLLFCWDQSHCTETGFNTVENKDKPLLLKELKKLWAHLRSNLPGREYDESNTLLLDDSPYKALSNPAHTAIFPHSYWYRDKGDSSLGPGGDLRVYLEGLAEAPNVQEYVAQNPFGQRAITESNASWGFYHKVISAL